MRPPAPAAARALLVIAKRPAPGQTKTRLSPPLHPEQAAALYECFLRDTLDVARAVPHVSRLVHYAPDDAAGYFATLAPDFGLRPQVGDNLGQRLDQVLTRCLREGFRQAVIMDSDSPTLPPAYVARAFSSLETADVVLGPCEDGGYYLIGLNQPQPRLLREVQMSTPHVLHDTLALAGQAGLRVALLPPWYDVDTAQELERLRADLALHANGAAPRTRAFLARPSASRPEGARRGNVSVIIPALNEAGCIGELVTAALAQPVSEVIVADNGSTDDTAGAARRAGARVVAEPRRGYGYACAAGAAAAGPGAEVLVFIDGDFSFAPDEMPRLLAPLAAGTADLVLGSRNLGSIERGSMPPPQRFGNWLVARLMRGLYHLPLTDLGPYRAVRRDLLAGLDMREMTFGWTTEMIVKAARRGARIVEAPVSYRARRAGQSKVSGTLRGTVLAGYTIVGTALRYAEWS